MFTCCVILTFTKPALSRFSNALEIIALSFYFISLFVRTIELHAWDIIGAIELHTYTLHVISLASCLI